MLIHIVEVSSGIDINEKTLKRLPTVMLFDYSDNRFFNWFSKFQK